MRTDRIKNYVQQIYRLLPSSKVWGRLFTTPEDLYVRVANHYPDIESPYGTNPETAPKSEYTSTMGKLLSLFAIQIARMDDVVYGLPEESTPTTAVETLDEWEEIYGIEDRTGTVQQRQDRIGEIFNERSTVRSTQFIMDLAESKGISLTIEDIINFEEGTDNFPWSGQWGAGELGASTMGNYGWGGIIRVTISRTVGMTFEEAVELLKPEIHHGTMIDWVNTSIGDIIMTTEATDTIEQTTIATDTITQG